MGRSRQPDETILPRLVAALSPSHIQDPLNKLDDQPLRDRYAGQAVINGWFRSVMVNEMKSQLHLRADAAAMNFRSVRLEGQSELVQQIVGDPHNLEFLTLAVPDFPSCL